MTLEWQANGQPTADSATLEHPRSRRHPDGRSFLFQTLLAHSRCNSRYQTVEDALMRHYPLRPKEREWLSLVASKRDQQVPAIQRQVDRLLELHAQKVSGRREGR